MNKFLKKNRDGTILFKSQKDLNHYIKEKVTAQKMELEYMAFELVLLLAVETLHLKFGFGNSRLLRFLEDVNFNLDSLNEGWYRYDELKEEYKHLFTVGE